MAESGRLSSEESLRYARHLTLPQVGIDGQARLKASSALIIGTGGLGSPVALYLAAAGVGRIGVVDFDRVEASNLQRQIIHGTSDIGRTKVASAAESIAEVNPFVEVECFDEALDSQNAMSIASRFDVIVDGTDNFATRYLVNDVCVLLKKPNCYGSIYQFEGQASVFAFDGGPCYRCLYPQPPAPGAVPNCAEGGVMGVLPGMIGTVQATEAIKILLGLGVNLSGRLLLIDALEMKFRELKVKRNPNCPVCGDHPTITAPIDYAQFCGMPPSGVVSCDRNVTPEELQRRRSQGDSFTLLDVREPHEYAICHLGGTLIPLAELPARLDELDRSRPVIVHCKSGGRSLKAVDILRQAGFEDVFNLQGGILAWAKDVDPSMPTY
ncbi:molybdopterin-synthase adenylyltransferase MoeB [Neorhodopirellula pilleata]|uniref:Molybdopterin-synthase adenylyltransferase n=1 Tax=Neorhodopirellula pilleata TaxID=2714738 RepID=A0A5C6A020_9BACT|nr:molybdopterin-synthase adenylyltransferase MoeB [Neorhodopirellula pilleata]TWT92631.1 putative adenylyltransferase/sulfurtransferase MoeZ [Neorhodopirellula pilleata]